MGNTLEHFTMGKHDGDIISHNPTMGKFERETQRNSERKSGGLGQGGSSGGCCAGV